MDSSSKNQRLISIDALRGFALFLLVCLGPVFSVLRNDSPISSFFNEGAGAFIATQMSHCEWEGFVLWDLIMPLFMFTTGLTIPFQFAKYRTPDGNQQYRAIFWRIFRRVLCLWILGMIVQGNLRNLQWDGLRLFSNTLQAIAVGYLFASLAYLFCSVKKQILFFCLALFAFWGASSWIVINGYGGGNFSPNANLAEYIDNALLGRWRDGVSFSPDGSWKLASWYHYTWILSSLTFIATTLSGVFAGELLRKDAILRKNALSDPALSTDYSSQQKKTVKALFVLGACFLVTGMLWSMIPEGYFGYCPLIKIIWTPSMVLFSSGISVLLLACFYQVLDVWKFQFGSIILIVLGTNSICAYTFPTFVCFDDIARRNFYGFQQYFGDWYPFFIVVSGVLLLWGILWRMHKSGIYWRV